MVSGENLPLIWSLSRKIRRRMCPLAAVLHYREAWRGFAPDADESDRRINQLHRVIPEKKYLRQLLLTVMRESFYRGDDDPEALFALAWSKCEHDFRQMVFGNAPQITTGLFNHQQSVADLRNDLKTSLFRQCCTLTAAWSDLLNIIPSQRRFIASPLKLNINELECYASPLLAYTSRGRLHIVELRSGDISAHAPEIMLMHRFYALNSSGRTPDSIVSCQLDYDSGTMHELASGFDASETLRAMALEAAEHRREMQLEPGDIPENTVNCKHCVFASFCGEKNRKEKKK